MIGALSGRERVLVALTVAIAVVLVGWTGVIEPILERQRATAELLPVREQILARRTDLLARKATLAAELDATRARLAAFDERFLPGATPAVAASELQKLVKEVAAQAGTQVRSERILPTVERGALLEIPIEIAVAGEIRQVVDLLARLERASKLLAVQDLKVRVINPAQPRELLVTLALSGFILQGKARA